MTIPKYSQKEIGQTEWSSMTNERFLFIYSPRIDVAVGPFATWPFGGPDKKSPPVYRRGSCTHYRDQSCSL